MVWQGTGIWLEINSELGIYIGLGAFIFCVSDSLLAYQRFKCPLKFGNSLVLCTYYVAQHFLTKSSVINSVNLLYT